MRPYDRKRGRGVAKTGLNMKLRALSVVVVLSIGVPACTTVDLSQVSIQSEASAAVPAKQNVVERASAALMSKFRSKGWCSGGPQEKTQTATSVLLNDVDSTLIENYDTSLKFSNETQLAAELISANEHVMQTTKAAEVFLAISKGITDVDSELSLLETALLSAKEAESRFEKAVAITGSSTVRQNFEALQTSVQSLKKITDRYGDHARSSIVTKSITTRS